MTIEPSVLTVICNACGHDMDMHWQHDPPACLECASGLCTIRVWRPRAPDEL